MLSLSLPKSKVDKCYTMTRAESTNAWSHQSQREVKRRLRDVGLVSCDSEEVLICTPCKYALQPSGQTVSKYLWEEHCMPAKERAGLDAFVQTLDLPDPNFEPRCPDDDPAHPHLLAQSGFACLKCKYRTTIQNLIKGHLSQEHGGRVACHPEHLGSCTSNTRRADDRRSHDGLRSDWRFSQ